VSKDLFMTDERSITAKQGGPLMVTGSVPITTKTPIESEQGEPLSWKTGEPDDVKVKVALCRCGGSSNKPYCDGTHADIEWDSNDDPPEGTYAERAENLGGEGIQIFDDRPICAHAGFCANEVTNVWEMADQTGDSQIRSQAMAMIERCPSGALTYAVDGDMIEPALPEQIAVTPGGPLWVTGGIAVTASDGTELETRNRVALCRCGASGSRPLCDGSHADIDFDG